MTHEAFGQIRWWGMPPMNKEESRAQARRTVAYIAVGALFAFLVALGVVYSQQVVSALSVAILAFQPLLIGCIFAFLVNLIMRNLERIYFPSIKRGPLASSRRPVCLILSIAIIAAVVAIIVNLVLPEIKASVSVIQDGVVLVAGDLYEWAKENMDVMLASLDGSGIENLERSFADVMASISSGDSSSVMNMLKSVFSTASSIAHNVFAIVVAFVFAIYVLIDKERVLKGLDSLVELFVPAHQAEQLRHAGHVANQAFSRFITGQCIEAVILGTLCAIGMSIFGMPYAVAIGATVGLTALIPVFGAWLGGAVGFLMILTVDPMTAIWFIVFLVVLQQIETHLIYPNVVGASVGLPGIWVFAGVIVGGALFGVVGMFLGVPSIATIRTLAIDYAAEVRERRAEAERKRKEEEEAEAARAAADPGPVVLSVAVGGGEGGVPVVELHTPEGTTDVTGSMRPIS